MNTEKRDKLQIESLKKREDAVLSDIYLEHRNEFLLWTQVSYSVDYDQGKEVFQDALMIWYDKLLGDRSKVDPIKETLFSIAESLFLESFNEHEKAIIHLEEKEVQQLKAQISSLDSQLNQELQDQLSTDEFEEPIKRSKVITTVLVILLLLGLYWLWTFKTSP